MMGLHRLISICTTGWARSYVQQVDLQQAMYLSKLSCQDCINLFPPAGIRIADVENTRHSTI